MCKKEFKQCIKSANCLDYHLKALAIILHVTLCYVIMSTYDKFQGLKSKMHGSKINNFMGLL